MSRPTWSDVVLASRREPYRVFFPLAVLFGGVGVGHWLLYSLHVIPVFSPLGHALVQVEAFLMAFACGFLMTMLPRRSGLPPASTGELLLLVGGVVAIAACALTGRFVASQVAFLATLGTLGAFAVRRLVARVSPRRAPDAFVLVPIGLASGVLGAITLLSGLVTDRTGAELLGRGLIQEGLFLCLILGLGHMLLPLLAGFDIPPDGDDSAASRRRRLLHALAGLVIVASFPVQHALIAAGLPLAGARAGYLLRAGAFLADFVPCLRAWRWPVAPGLHRRFAWLAFWLVPMGELLAGVFPRHAIGFAHITFIGGFALLAFVVGAHVILAHSGDVPLTEGRPWQVWGFAILFLMAMATRVVAEFLPPVAYWTHLGWAALLWLIGLGLWSAWLLPRIGKRPPPPQTRELPVIRQH